MTQDARGIRLTALASAHQTMALLYTELLLEVDDRRQFDITKQMLEIRSLITALGGLRHE